MYLENWWPLCLACFVIFLAFFTTKYISFIEHINFLVICHWQLIRKHINSLAIKWHQKCEAMKCIFISVHIDFNACVLSSWPIRFIEICSKQMCCHHLNESTGARIRPAPDAYVRCNKCIKSHIDKFTVQFKANGILHIFSNWNAVEMGVFVLRVCND